MYHDKLSEQVNEPTVIDTAKSSELPATNGAAAVTVTSNITSERTLWYVEKLFTYTNQLIERTQIRCNYLILANSVAAVAFFTTMNTLLSNRTQTAHLLSNPTTLLLIMVPTSIFLCSLVTAVLAFLPKIYEYEIELNQEFIARMPVKMYKEFVLAKTDESKLGDFVEEVHVLSRILNDKNRLVNAAARIFLLAVVTIPVVIAATLL